jgi:hypothetical protein
MMAILLGMLLDSSFVDEEGKHGQHIISNPDVAPLVFGLVPLCSVEDQGWVLDRFLDLFSAEENYASVLNVNLCCRAKPSIVDDMLRLMEGTSGNGRWIDVFEVPALMSKMLQIFEYCTSQVRTNLPPL